MIYDILHQGKDVLYILLSGDVDVKYSIVCGGKDVSYNILHWGTDILYDMLNKSWVYYTISYHIMSYHYEKKWAGQEMGSLGSLGGPLRLFRQF